MSLHILLLTYLLTYIHFTLFKIEADLKDGQNENAVETLQEVFAGNVLTEVYCHFESKLEGQNVMEDANLADCHRACVALLNCAGKVEESKVEGMRSHIIHELCKSSDIMSAEPRRRANFAPNVALLCAWGMTDDVAKCLASSISRYFAGDADEMNTSRLAQKSGSSKRKQRGKKQVVDEAALPTKLDVDVCLLILGGVLKGSYPASVLARESILGSETAFNAIASALQTAKSAAERMLLPQIVSLMSA